MFVVDCYWCYAGNTKFSLFELFDEWLEGGFRQCKCGLEVKLYEYHHWLFEIARRSSHDGWIKCEDPGRNFGFTIFKKLNCLNILLLK